MLTEEEKTKMALGNYERFFKLVPGSATVKKVNASYAGIEGWWRWNPDEYSPSPTYRGDGKQRAQDMYQEMVDRMGAAGEPAEQAKETKQRK